MVKQIFNRNRIVIFGVCVFIFFSACSARNEILPTPTNPASIIEETELQPSAELLEPTPEQPIVSDDKYKNTDPTGQLVTFWHPYTAENEAVLKEIVADFNTGRGKRNRSIARDLIKRNNGSIMAKANIDRIA